MQVEENSHAKIKYINRLRNGVKLNLREQSN